MMKILRPLLAFFLLLVLINGCKKDDVEVLTPDVEWNAPTSIGLGNELSATELNATTNVDGVFIYDPKLGTVMNEQGDQTLTLVFTPKDEAKYQSVTITKTISVNNNKPEIYWNYPGSIIYGTKLSDKQLDATCSVDGEFVYTPPLGTLLDVGNTQPLKVEFIPKSNSYSRTEKAISINVLKITPILEWYQTEDFNLYKGQVLSDTIFTASSDMPGTFKYSDNTKTFLEVGWQTFTAEFIPEDIERVESESIEVHVYVNDYYQVIQDHEGNIYHTIKIGDQHWMAENLRSTTFIDGTPLKNIKGDAEWESTNEAGYCWYNNDESLAIPYGAYYNQYVLSDEMCPSGWRLPNDDDARELTDYRPENWQGYIGDKAPTTGWKELLSMENINSVDDLGGVEIDFFKENIIPNGLNLQATGYRDISGDFYYFQIEAYMRSTSGAVGADARGNMHSFLGTPIEISGMPIRCIEE